MSHSDPIADMLTRIRNAHAIRRRKVEVRNSRTNRGILEVLKREGFIGDYELIKNDVQGTLKVALKYGPNGETILNSIVRKSKPGRRMYVRAEEIEPVLAGRGISIVSTSKGVMSDRECREARLGGELLCTVW
jgi:small subunit ribosomal protein S8